MSSQRLTLPGRNGPESPHAWEGWALLKWYADGRQVGAEKITFSVECLAPPEGDVVTDAQQRELTTLRLVCDEVRQRYGVAPESIDAYVSADPSPTPARARWRRGSGGFCHGNGIMRVAAPPSGVRLLDLQRAEAFTEQGE